MTQFISGVGILAGIFLFVMSTILYRLSATDSQRGAALWVAVLGLSLLSGSVVVFVFGCNCS